MTNLWEAIKGKLEADGHLIERRGRHIFILCPFHLEDIPSCVVNPDLNVFHCFGCHTKGTLQKLARHLGVMVSDDDELALLYKAWENAEKAQTLIYQRRKIPPIISSIYRVGYIENGKPEILIPHPAPDDIGGFIVWDLKSYHFSKGLSKAIPFGYSLVNGNEVYVVEGVFDAMAVKSVMVDAVATLGGNTVLGIADMFPTLILAPDNDETGKQYLARWAKELMEIGRLASAKVCLWRSKDPNDALMRDTLTDEIKRVLWLPTYLIIRAVMEAKFEIEQAKVIAEPTLRELTEKQRERAVREAQSILTRHKPNLDLQSLLDLGEPAWVKVLKSATCDPELRTFLLNLPDFNLTLMPTSVRNFFMSALAGNLPSLKSPFAKNAVKWAWRKAREQAIQQLKRKFNL